MEKLKRVAKAIVAAAVAGFASFITAQDGGIDASEAGIIAAAIVGAFFATYAVPNAPKEA